VKLTESLKLHECPLSQTKSAGELSAVGICLLSRMETFRQSTADEIISLISFTERLASVWTAERSEFESR
jgi:hypothetical protein